MKTEYELIIRPGVIDFAPGSLIEEVMQNIITICSTSKFSVPMDRDFGVNAAYLDDPVNTVQNKLAAEIVQAVRKFEPRARVTHVSFIIEGEHVYPSIKFRLTKEAING